MNHRERVLLMVRLTRLELTTFGSGGQRSIQLSYSRIFLSLGGQLVYYNAL